MTIHQPAKLLKIYIGESYYFNGFPIYETILGEAKQQNISGVTVIRGDEGMGHVGVVQNRDNERNHDLPIMIEIIDTAEKIEKFIPAAAKVMGNHGLIAVSDVTIVHRGITVPVSSAKDPLGNDIKGRD